MLQPEIDLSAVHEQCAQAVDLLLNRHQWQLLNRAEFVQRTCAEVQHNGYNPQRAAIHTYCLVLHTACAGDEGAARQTQAYEELFRYLYAIAHQHYPEVAAEAAQHALEQIFITFEHIQQPGAFLAWALQRLRDAARSLRQQARLAMQSLETAVADGHLLRDVLPDAQQPAPDAELLNHELRLRFQAVVTEFLRQHPRASQQFAALQLKYIDDLDDTVIGQRLGVSVKNVYVLRSRAIKRLQADQRWRALAVELGIVPHEDEPKGVDA